MGRMFEAEQAASHPKPSSIMALVPQGTTRTKWTRELTQDDEVSACLASNFLAKLQTHVVSGFNNWASSFPAGEQESF